MREKEINELAEVVGINPISVRHHLNSLQADGLIEAEEERISLEVALKAATLNGAYTIGLEDESAPLRSARRPTSSLSTRIFSILM